MIQHNGMDHIKYTVFHKKLYKMLVLRIFVSKNYSLTMWGIHEKHGWTVCKQAAFFKVTADVLCNNHWPLNSYVNNTFSRTWVLPKLLTCDFLVCYGLGCVEFKTLQSVGGYHCFREKFCLHLRVWRTFLSLCWSINIYPYKVRGFKTQNSTLYLFV